MNTVALGDVLSDIQPGFASGDDLDDGVFQIRMNNVTRDGRLVLAERRRVNPSQMQLRKYTLRGGDVLFNATNSPDLVGKTAYFPGCDELAAYSNHFLRLRTDPSRLDPRYLARWLRRLFHQGYFRAKSKQWSNQATFGADRLVELTIPLPPIEEQRRIAAVLDAADALRAKRRETLAKLGTLTQAIFIDMFGEPASPTAPLVPLAQVVGAPITRGIDQPGPDVEDGVPYLKTTDFGEASPRREVLARSDPAIAARFPRSVVRTGDTVICIRATVGPTVYISEELNGVNLSRGTARVTPSSAVLPKFLHTALNSVHFQRQIQRKLRGATFLQIPLKELKELKVPLPPIGEQRRLVEAVEAVDAQIATAHISQASLDDLLASLQQRAFRGEL